MRMIVVLGLLLSGCDGGTCTTTSDCTYHNVCDVRTASCVSRTRCNTNADCQDGFACDGYNCNVSCTTYSDCTVGYTCFSHDCQTGLGAPCDPSQYDKVVQTCGGQSCDPVTRRCTTPTTCTGSAACGGTFNCDTSDSKRSTCYTYCAGFEGCAYPHTCDDTTHVCQ
jgi:hypothetical protein